MSNSVSDHDDDEPCCETCGSTMESEECENCYGEGEFDLYEDDPINYAPGETETCQECDGIGFIWYCPNAKHHPDDNQPDAPDQAEPDT